ncbi:hypothetical protein SAY86_003935 [Trapa natans]|uniref:HD-ZIP protein N-terminal domain-containing protein n=1 Tax=Trapa natans TaxID=22666 RepID=A0AAN7M6Z6_TRANT|nr:hypothetical protein SAY86_003935 [Trapa natans]
MMPPTTDFEEEGGVSSPNSTISTVSGKRSERIKREGIVPWNQPRGGWRPLEEEAEALQEPGRNPRGELQRAQYSQPESSKPHKSARDISYA